MVLDAGIRLGPFEILALLGAGGMGEVYRARDMRLDRDVAIKVLPESTARDPARVARFEREAKLLASLNHPNVGAIYGFDEADGKKFLVLEYVEGETLAVRLKRGALPVDHALEVARQVTAGVEAAHERGVIHRDLKPGNVMINPHGTVKVLDFGLAKAAAGDLRVSGLAESSTITADYTRPGLVLGTAAYMSPEQARGQGVDKRTDVWAFGCVLFEMLTATRPFDGESTNDAIGAVLHKEPEWRKLPTSVPGNVRRALRRCLVKDVRNRLHHIADARIELEETEPPAPGGRASMRGHRIALAVLGGVAAVLLTISLWSARDRDRSGGPASGDNPLAGARFSRITDFDGSEFDAAISPDGRFVSFVAAQNGPYDVFVGQIETGSIRNLSRGRDAFRLTDDAKAPIRTVGFSADGSEIWFASGADRRLRATPLLGGSMRNLLGEDIVNLDWSPDGKRVVYHKGKETPGDPLYVADRDGTNSRLVLRGGEGVHQHFPTWSVDGEWIYVVRGRPRLEMDLWRVRPDGRDAERLTRQKLDVRYPAPIDEQTVLYSAFDSDGAGPWLWALDVETKSSRRASIGMEQYRSVSASADGRRLVATLQTPTAALWAVPVLDRVATERDAEPLPKLPTERAFAPRLHDSWLFFLASRGSGAGLWRYRDGEAEEIWRGSVTPLLEPVAISPDGESVALVLRRQGRRRLHVLSADGARLSALTNNVEVHGAPSWAPDGQWIVTGGIQRGVPGLFKVPIDGGSPEHIADGVATNPVWSPDGGVIVYAGAEVGPTAPLRAVRPDGVPVELPDISVRTGGERARFLPDGEGLVYMAGLDVSQDFRVLDMNTMEDRLLADLKEGPTMRTFDVSPDGSRIVFDRLSDDSDIVLIERRTTSEAGPREQ